VPHWLIVPELLRGGDLVAVVPRRFADAVTGGGTGLTARAMGFAPGRFVWSLYWHRRYEADPASHWLRQQIGAVAAAL
jgi:DNA-binding transcriptional LysR family regulator